MVSSVADQSMTLKLSARTLDDYAAAAGQKYMNLNSRLKQKIKSVPILDKIAKNVKAWDRKMTQLHPAAYKFAKGAVIGASVGVALAVAGAEVATAYAAVNAVRAVGNLLSESEKARREGKVSGFSDFASKNKTAVGLAAISVGMSAAGVTAGVIDNQAALSVISAARQAAVGGMMAASTATKVHKINSDMKDGKITAEQAKQARKGQYAELAGNLAGLAVVAEMSSQMDTNAFADHQVQNQASQPSSDHVYDGGTLPEVTVTAQAPDRVYDGGVLPEAVVTGPTPEHVPQTEPVAVPREPLQPLQPLSEIVPPPLEPVLPEIRSPAIQVPISVERESYVSYTQQVSPTDHIVNLDIAENDHVSKDYDSSSLFVSVKDIEGSQAKVMSLSLQNGGEYSEAASLHIDADGKVTQLPDWEHMPDQNADCKLSQQEIREWSEKRQVSLQTVLSEQEARNVARSEISEEIKRYGGDNIYSVSGEQNSGTTSYNGPADKLGDNEAARVREIGSQRADQIADSARKVMCERIDGQGNARQVGATEKQIQVADVLLRSAANKIR